MNQELQVRRLDNGYQVLCDGTGQVIGRQTAVTVEQSLDIGMGQALVTVTFRVEAENITSEPPMQIKGTWLEKSLK